MWAQIHALHTGKENKTIEKLEISNYSRKLCGMTYFVDIK
jgi:hypothetical protein